MPIKQFAHIEFNHQQIGFCEQSNILYCFIWKWEDHLLLYVGKNFTSNESGNNTALSRLGSHLFNYNGRTNTHSIFNKFPQLRKEDFEIKMLLITDEVLTNVETAVVNSLETRQVGTQLVEDIIEKFIGNHDRRKIQVLNGQKKRLLSEPF